MREHKASDSPSGYDREIQPRRPTRAELHDGTFQMPPPKVSPPRAWVTVGELEELQGDDALPRRGYALRPDLTGAQILYDDARPLGRATRVEHFKDYTIPNPLEEIRVQYEPTMPASA